MIHRRGPGVARVPRIVGVRSADHRHRPRRRDPRCRGVSRGDVAARRAARHRRRARPDGGRTGRRLRGSHRARLCGRVSDILQRHAVPSRHRSQGAEVRNRKSELRSMKYSVITFGCRVNQADSLGFEEALRAAGAVAVPPDAADLVVVNTCSVTASADQGARQTIRRVARNNPGARIVVTGCCSTRRPAEMAALPNVACVVPNDDKPQLIQVLRSTPTTAERFGDGDGSCGAAIEPGVAGRTAFTLRVQTGCAEPCSYCIIPTTRGTPRSVPVGDVLREVDRVASAGYKEIALTGVHLGSYGRDLQPRASLIGLLRALDEVRLEPDAMFRGAKASAFAEAPADRRSPGGGWSAERHDLLFRISSLEPMDCSREIVELVATSKRFAP